MVSRKEGISGIRERLDKRFGRIGIFLYTFLDAARSLELIHAEMVAEYIPTSCN